MSLFPHLQDKCLNSQGMVMQQTSFELQLLPMYKAVLKADGITSPSTIIHLGKTHGETLLIHIS